MAIKKAVIAAAGLGTRLLPTTKELPKEMLPIFSKGSMGLSLKPTIQLAFEQLYRNGFREFCFIVGRGKRSVEDHFTPDWGYIESLENENKKGAVRDLQAFYEMIESSTLIWVNQPKPKGFGHAVLLSRPFIGNDLFLVAAGDTYIISREDDHIRSLINLIDSNSASLLLKRVTDISMYGAALLDGSRVLRVVEKPSEPISDLAIMPLYAFAPSIFGAIENTPQGKGGEIQLTDAIQRLIDSGESVMASILKTDDLMFDIGTPKSYWESVRTSYKLFAGENS